MSGVPHPWCRSRGPAWPLRGLGKQDAGPCWLDIFGQRFPSPGGRFENSPAVHCRVSIRCCISPEGTVEYLRWLTSASISIDVGVIQPSLRDGTILIQSPTLERVGYFQISLREIANGCSVLSAHCWAGNWPNSRRRRNAYSSTQSGSCTPSCASNLRFQSRPPEKPPSLPPEATTRWHGTRTGIGLA